MARRRRDSQIFSMSFLDCMSCGFGAVILFFMIINAQVRETTEDDPDDRMAETRKLEVEVLEGRKNLVLARNTIEELEARKETTQGQIDQILALLEELRAWKLKSSGCSSLPKSNRMKATVFASLTTKARVRAST